MRGEGRQVGSHLRNCSVYAIPRDHIYEIIPCTRYSGITSTESFRERDTPRSHLQNHSVYAIPRDHIYEITPCTRYARITSTELFRVRDTPRSHLRNRSVYAIRPDHIYGIIPCTRYTGITSPKSFRVRDTPESHLRNHSVYAIRPDHIYEILPCTRYAQITSPQPFRVRDTTKSHLRNCSVYAIRPDHIYGIIPCTRYTGPPPERISAHPPPHKKAPVHNWTGATPTYIEAKSRFPPRLRRAVAEHAHEVLQHRRVQQHELENAHDAFDAPGFLDQPVKPLELELDADFRCALGFAAQYVEAAADAHEDTFIKPADIIGDPLFLALHAECDEHDVWLAVHDHIDDALVGRIEITVVAAGDFQAGPLFPGILDSFFVRILRRTEEEHAVAVFRGVVEHAVHHIDAADPLGQRMAHEHRRID